jgi:hypothetical protein
VLLIPLPARVPSGGRRGAHREQQDHDAEHADLLHPLVELGPGLVGQGQRGDDDLLDRRDDAHHEERLGDEASFGHRGADRAQQLDQDEHEQQAVEGGGHRVDRAGVGAIDEPVAHGHERGDGAHEQQHGHADVDHPLAQQHRGVQRAGQGAAVGPGVSFGHGRGPRSPTMVMHVPLPTTSRATRTAVRGGRP